ncbi:hypothetical protein ACP70R_001471 [Stipagrostis hirtigluma subsp. patula]
MKYGILHRLQEMRYGFFARVREFKLWMHQSCFIYISFCLIEVAGSKLIAWPDENKEYYHIFLNATGIMHSWDSRFHERKAIMSTLTKLLPPFNLFKFHYVDVPKKAVSITEVTENEIKKIRTWLRICGCPEEGNFRSKNDIVWAVVY